jgi:hypothetical protein
MLEFLKGKASDRKLRLFAVACCRRIWHLFTDKQSRRAVEVAERLADGQADPAEVADTGTEIEELLALKQQEWIGEASRSEAAYLYGYRDQWPIILAQSAVGEDVTTEWVDLAGSIANTDEAARADRTAQAALLRDIFGNPFRPITLDPAWLTWHDGLIPSMANRIYDSRDFRDMPVLADALEEAGCQDQDILRHCRLGGEHVRGCWVVDLLLGKE